MVLAALLLLGVAAATCSIGQHQVVTPDCDLPTPLLGRWKKEPMKKRTGRQAGARRAAIKRGALILIALLLPVSCGFPAAPSVAASFMVGTWGARLAPAHFDVLVLRFCQQENAVRGVASYLSGPDVVFQDIPIQIDNPNVSFTVPLNAPGAPGFTFSGTVGVDGSLHGEWSFPGRPANKIVLGRTGTSDTC
jgi:hypothetical protein